MSNYDRTTNKHKQPAAIHVTQRRGQSRPAVQFAGNGARGLQAMADSSPQVKQMQAYQAMANGYSADRVVQRKGIISTGPVIQRAELRPASGTGATHKKKIITTEGFETNHLFDDDITDEIALAKKAARVPPVAKNTVVKRSALIEKIGDSNPPVGIPVDYEGFGDAEAKNVLSPNKGAEVRSFSARSVTLRADRGTHGEIKLFHLDSAGQDIVGDGAEFPLPSTPRPVPTVTSLPVTSGGGAGVPTGGGGMTKTARKKANKANRGF